jgi:glycosyltransferase involved in cell wall biosynthesis
MKTVLHYKTNFLNPSETFIHRLISNHISYSPSALCLRKLQFTDNVEVHEVPKSGVSKWVNHTAFHLNFALPFFERIIKQKKPDVVHAHFGYDGYKLLGICEKYDIPLVISFYGSDVSRLPGELFWKSRFQKMAKSQARIVAASEYMKNQLTDLGFPVSNIDVVRFGLDLKKLSFKKSNSSIDKWMMVGRLVEKKGFATALKAAKIVAEKMPDFTLDIYGDGPQLANLRNLQDKLGLEKQVCFNGFQPIEKIVGSHLAHGLFIAPSETARDGDMEGLPNTILESMAIGTPVVSTRHAAIPEVIKHGKSGFLVDENSPKQLAEVLLDILSGRFNITNIRQQARKTIEHLHDVQIMANDIEKVYDRASGR